MFADNFLARRCFALDCCCKFCAIEGIECRTPLLGICALRRMKDNRSVCAFGI